MPRRKRDTEKPGKPTERQLAALGDLVNTGEALTPVMLALKDIAAESLKIFVPRPELAYGVNICGKYNADMHAKVCRLKLLGLSDASCARALRINPTTLSEWREKYPQLSCDMDSAAELANAHAAVILKTLMLGDGPTAFNAVRFYLTTHSKEFREPTSVPQASDINVTIQQIRQQIYGLPPERRTVEPEQITLIEREALAVDEDDRMDVHLLPAAAALDDL